MKFCQPLLVITVIVRSDHNTQPADEYATVTVRTPEPEHLPPDKTSDPVASDINNCTVTAIRIANIIEDASKDIVVNCNMSLHIDMATVFKKGAYTDDCDEDCSDKLLRENSDCDASCKVDGDDISIAEAVGNKDGCGNVSDCDMSTKQCVNTPTSYVCSCKEGLVPVFNNRY